MPRSGPWQSKPYSAWKLIALNLENPVELDEFLRNRSKQIRVPFSKNTVT